MGMRAVVLKIMKGSEVTVTTNGNSVDNLKASDSAGSIGLGSGLPVGAHDELGVDVTVTAFAGATSITFFMERLGADGVWYQTGTSTPLVLNGTWTITFSAQNSSSQSFALINRLRWTIQAPAGPIISFSASVIGK